MPVNYMRKVKLKYQCYMLALYLTVVFTCKIQNGIDEIQSGIDEIQNGIDEIQRH